MIRFIIFSLISIGGLSCYDQKHAPLINTGINTIADTFVVNINKNYWKGILHYSKLNGPDSFLAIDSITTLQSDNKTLNTIFTNRDEEYFTFPLVSVTGAQNIDSLMNTWLSNDYTKDRNEIIIQDINFDGFDDLLLYNRLYSGATNRFYDIWVYNKKTGDYNLWYLSKRLGLWKVDTANKTLVFGFRTGTQYISEQHRIISDTITRVIVIDKE